MNEAATPEGGTGLFGDLLDRFTEIVGPAASEATFHFASLQEGMRMASGYGPQDLEQALARIDGVVGQQSRVEQDDGDFVRIVVAGSTLLAQGNPVRQAVVRGLLEGMLRSLRGRPYVGKVLEGRGNEATLEFRQETSHGEP